MLNMGSLKTQPESCWHCCFHTSEMCCNLFWKADLSPIREIQRCLRQIIKENKISILVVSWGGWECFGLAWKDIQSHGLLSVLTVTQLATRCVSCRACTEFCLHQSQLWMLSLWLSCDLIAFLTHLNLFHVRRPLSLASCLQPSNSCQSTLGIWHFLSWLSIYLCV